jgi:Ca2+-binding EF-hand superfamily protein
MKKQLIAAAVGVSGLLVVAAWAQEQVESARRDGRTRIADVEKFLKERDKNSDGFLTKEEIPECRDFEQIDRNKDSKLSREELQSHARQMRRPRPVTLAYIWVFDADREHLSEEDLQNAYNLLRKLDANNDGKLARDEIRAAKRDVSEKLIASRIEEMDDDRDGKLSRNEARGWIGQRFEKMDQNGDGHLSREELVEACTGRETVFTSERSETEDRNP